MGGSDLLSYAEARKAIYLPVYRWVLENRLASELEDLREVASRGHLVLLDYETNVDVEDLRRPLSHAGLVRAWLCEEWPGGET